MIVVNFDEFDLDQAFDLPPGPCMKVSADGSLWRRWRGVLGVAAFNLVLIGATLLAAEAYVRYHSSQVSQDSSDDQLPMCEPDDVRIWRYKPNVAIRYRHPEFEIAIRTNDDRLRSNGTRNADAPLIIFIGDSFTFGWGVDENERFSEVAADLLSAKYGTTVQIINAGHWMYTFDQQLLVLKQLLAQHRAAVVVQGIYWPHVRTLFNHVPTFDRAGALTDTRDAAIKVSENGVLKFRSDMLERPPLNSRLIAAIARRVLNYEMTAEAANIDPWLTPGARHNDHLWALTGRLLSEASRTAREHGATYLPLYIPMNVEVSDRYWSAPWGRPVVPQGLDVRQPFERLRRIVADNGEELIDPTKRLQTSAASAYFSNDMHLTRTGNRLLGEFLASALERAIKAR